MRPAGLHFAPKTAQVVEPDVGEPAPGTRRSGSTAPATARRTGTTAPCQSGGSSMMYLRVGSPVKPRRPRAFEKGLQMLQPLLQNQGLGVVQEVQMTLRPHGGHLGVVHFRRRIGDTRDEISRDVSRRTSRPRLHVVAVIAVERRRRTRKRPSPRVGVPQGSRCWKAGISSIRRPGSIASVSSAGMAVPNSNSSGSFGGEYRKR